MASPRRPRSTRAIGPDAASGSRASARAAAAERAALPQRHVLPWLLCAAALAVFGVASWRLNAFVMDDVFISLRYGRHLLAGLGLVYNPGERVEGYTNFLWTLLAAPATRMPFGVVPYLRLLNGACALLAAWQAGELAARVAAGGANAGRAPLPGASAAWIALGAAMFLVTPAVIVSTAEGLETLLFTALLVTAANRLLADRAERPVPLAGLCLAALALTRADGVLFVGWGVLAAWWLGRPRSYVVRLALTAGGLWAVYWAARWAWYGPPFPNTFVAKGAGGALLFARGSAELVRFAGVMGGWALLLAVVPLVRANRRLPVALAVAIAIRVAFQVWSGGPSLGRFRFLVPIVPFAQALVLAGAASGSRRPRLRLALACAAGALMLVPGWLAYPDAEAEALRYANGLAQAHGRLGQDLLRHTTPRAVIAMDDAGLAPYECDRTTVDMLGINDRHMARLPGRFEERVDVPYVLGRHPDVIVLVSNVPLPAHDADFWLAPHAAMFRDPAFRATYGYSRRYQFTSGYFLVVFRRHGSLEAPAGFWGGEGGVQPAS